MYDKAFFDMIREGSRSSAAVVAPLVNAQLDSIEGEPHLVDVGCGEGWWGAAFQDLGWTVLGVDQDAGVDRPIPFRAHDLTKPLPFDLLGGFDLAVCLEVAEHLPEARADGLVEDLCRLAPVVLFSAAIPGQGGVGHINEQWPEYWVSRFRRNGFEVSGALRWWIWGRPEVENWYQQNTLVAAREPGLLPNLFASPMATVFPVVHPVLFDARRS